MNKGFTIVELLASIGIMALIIVISVPAYNGISNTIKQNSYDSKISMIEKSTKSYINKYHKDKVFDGEIKKICFSINYLISKNVFTPDNETDDGMLNPKTNNNLEGFIEATYDIDTYDVIVNFSVDTANYNNSYCTGGIY